MTSGWELGIKMVCMSGWGWTGQDGLRQILGQRWSGTRIGYRAARSIGYKDEDPTRVDLGTRMERVEMTNRY